VEGRCRKLAAPTMLPFGFRNFFAAVHESAVALFANSLRCNGASAAEGRPSVARLASSRQPETRSRSCSILTISWFGHADRISLMSSDLAQGIRSIDSVRGEVERLLLSPAARVRWASCCRSAG
jgi:hypothetical protein